MADAKVPEAEDSAEKAYAAASEVLTVQPVPSDAEEAGVGAEAVAEVPADTAPVERDATPVEFPAKAKRERKDRPVAEPAVAEPAPIAPPPVAKAVPRKPAPPKAKPVSKAPVRKAPVNKAPVNKAGVVKATAVKAKPAPKPVASKPATKPAKITVSNTKNTHSIVQLKDKIMATTKTPDFTKNIQDALADAQGKAKAAFEKGTSSLGEITEFTKGNVEALVESGKILVAGAQDLGSTYAAESRAAFETLSADVKELASAKTPTDFVKLQGDLLRRSFDAAVAAGSKNSEAFLKLANEAFAPISGRFSVAMDKAKKAA